ncbi:MAG: acyl carrier protein [Bacteroidota bacterium]
MSAKKEDKLLAIVNTVLENRGKHRRGSIEAEDTLRETIGFDSLDLAELTVRIEAEFDVDIFEEGVVTTISEILEKIDE